MKKMEELQKEYRKMWRRLGFSKPPCELLTKADNRGGRHVEYKDGKYYWTATEYGSWLDFQETSRKDEVLEWIALYITEWQAFGAVQGSGKRGRERDIWQLAYQIELLQKINPEWAARHREKMQAAFPEVAIVPFAAKDFKP